MDITLERILSLIPKKPDGKFKHGAKKEFAESLNLRSGNLIPDWVSGRSNSYMNYLYEISEKYNVSVEWLRGETDTKEKPTSWGTDESLERILGKMSKEQLIDVITMATAALREKELNNGHNFRAYFVIDTEET
jgi:hypothetical protein